MMVFSSTHLEVLPVQRFQRDDVSNSQVPDVLQIEQPEGKPVVATPIASLLPLALRCKLWELCTVVGTLTCAI